MAGKVPDVAYWVALSSVVRGRVLKRIFEYFSSGEEMWLSSRETLMVAGVTPEMAERIASERPRLDPAPSFEKMLAEHIAVATLASPEYPECLRQTSDPPAILFYKGKLPEASAVSLGVVGTRNVTAYGQSVALSLARDFARAGCTVVSGLARGVDALAHEAAVDVGGRTVAVIGSGLNRASLYPREHWRLSEAMIAHGGAILSEYPPSVGPERHHFPERNRIIAGLCRGVVVVEAPEKSGALITAYQALDENREVFAVPGSIFEKNSFGTNRLIQRGANLATSAADVFAALGLVLEKKENPAPSLSADETVVLKTLSETPRQIDEIIMVSHLPTAAAVGALSLLEMKGLVKDLGGKRYVSTL